MPMQIKMSTETERRVENLLDRSKDVGAKSSSTSTFVEGDKKTLTTLPISISESISSFNTSKEKFSAQLRDLQDSKKVVFLLVFETTISKMEPYNCLFVFAIMFIIILSPAGIPECQSNVGFQGKVTSIQNEG